MSDTINTKMTALANAIRNKSGRTDKLTLDEMATAVQSIEVGVDTSDATAVAADIMEGQTAYVDGSKLTGTFTLDSESSAQDTLITNIKTALAGKASAVPVLQNKTVAPSTSQQVVSADSGYDGLRQVTVSAMRLQDKTITENGEYTADSGYDGLGSISVNVEGSGGGTKTISVYVTPNNLSGVRWFDENGTVCATFNNQFVAALGGLIFCPQLGGMVEATATGSYIYSNTTFSEPYYCFFEDGGTLTLYSTEPI